MWVNIGREDKIGEGGGKEGILRGEGKRRETSGLQNSPSRQA